MPRDVEVPALSLSAFQPLIGDERYANLRAAAEATRSLLDGSVIWNVNSTASGGGVAEMLRVLVGYIRGAGVHSRWVVIDGDPVFFEITKRIHNRIHGMQGDAGQLGRVEQAHYAEVSAANASSLQARVRSGDVVLLHDPQTVGLAHPLTQAGAKVIWRSHIGADQSNTWTDEAWKFLRPHLSSCKAFVFSRSSYVPSWIPAERVSIIAPSIDPFSPKNQLIAADELPLYLSRIGLTAGPTGRRALFRRTDGTLGEVVRGAAVVSEGETPTSLRNLVVQVSRWDRLKDMHGVMTGFAAHVPARVDAELALVGPAVEGVADDPEAANVFAECIATWKRLPIASRRRIRLVTLPMDDIEENAAMVNAVQRSASVIVQKSLVEGFGLTVAEGMWKGKPPVASRVGGIIDQVTPDTGILLDNPADLDTFGDTLATLLENPNEITRLGNNAHRRVREEFLGDHHLLLYSALIQRMKSEST